MRISAILKKAERSVRKIPAFIKRTKAKLSSLKSDSPSFNKLIRSSVALALMLIMLITITFSWLGDSFTSNIGSNDFITIDADAGLQMNYGEENQPDGSIKINNVLKTGFELQECSSADGRNIFFPTYEYSSSDKEYVEDVETGDLLFREATASDKNTNYISVDFTLSSQGETDIWLSTSSRIYCTNQDNTAANAIRVAFVDKSVDGVSTVFDNSFAESYTEDHYPVESISTTGIADDDTAYRPHAFSEYMFGNEEDNKLFHISAGETLKAAMIVWLEGTDDDCHSPVLGINDIQIYIELTTSYEEMKPITFIDNTLEKWVDDHDCFVFILDDENIPHMMTKSATYDTDYTWTGYVPSGVTDIKFARYNPLSQSSNPEKWNNWDAGALGACTTYNAIGHSAGIWKDGFKAQQITVFDGTNNGWLRGSAQCEFHVLYTTTDGNGNTQNMDYKMSYQTELNRYSIIIPSEVTTLSFNRMNSDQTVTHNSWNNLNRGSNYFYNITASGTGYWSTRYIYINDAENLKGTDSFGAYFYGTAGNQWTGMHSKSPSGYYVAVVPNNMTNGVVFTRFNGSSMPSWENCNNQTPKNLESFGSNNRFTTSPWTGDNVIYGTWSYTPE